MCCGEDVSTEGVSVLVGELWVGYVSMSFLSVLWLFCSVIGSFAGHLVGRLRVVRQAVLAALF